MLSPFDHPQDEVSNVVVVGSGAREAAIALALSKDRAIDTVYVIPGNCGINENEPGRRICSVDLDLGKDFCNLLEFCRKKEISLVVPGPEKCIAEGITDVLQKHGIKCFGPSKKASILEASKSFSKHFMKDADIPTATFETFNEFDKAVDYVKSREVKEIVIKASGLAAGKGVYLPDTFDEAVKALKLILLDGIYDVKEVVIEKRLVGQEVSVICICDGYTALQLPAAQDHKRAYDNDEGPNTGGMGSYAPLAFYTDAIRNKVQECIIQRTLDGMRKLKMPFVGALFVGLMLTKDGPYVLEFNVRFGDPEVQVILPLLSDNCSLYKILLAAVDHYLDKITLKFKPDTSVVNVVLASAGYPGPFKKNVPLHIPDNIPKEYTSILHSGTALSGSQLVATGGRVLSVVSIGTSIDEALERSYNAIRTIELEGAHYRKDIAKSHTYSFKHDIKMTYEGAGVSIKTAESLVDEIKHIALITNRSGVVDSIGSFGGLFDLKLAGYLDPVLVSGADGVGTKIKIAQICNAYDGIGIDLVAMNVNDVVAMGAEPLFFLDYYSCGKLNKTTASAIISSIASGCAIAGCALIGGETSEMPGLYENEEFDIAGFCVGAFERGHGFPKVESICENDVIIGLLSDGLHSNGFSLVRRIIEEHNIYYDPECSFSQDVKLLYDELLRPTKIYVKPVMSVIKEFKSVKALAHITGGGMSSNIVRVLGNYTNAVVDCKSWELPPIFKWVKTLGDVENEELERTFNCGIGMVMVTGPEESNRIVEFLGDCGCPSRIIGYIRRGVSLKPSVSFINMDEYW